MAQVAENRHGCPACSFFPGSNWIPEPADFARNAPPGQRYDLTSGERERVWLECLARAGEQWELAIADGPDRSIHIPGGYGEPTLVRPRLGQRSFRIAVLDSYERRCAITNDRTLPVLEAAHIRDYADVQQHSINNGLLFRSDIHKLFDGGYVTVTADYHFEVSKRIREEFENGRDYYKLHGAEIRLPAHVVDRPMPELLRWHHEERYLG